MLKKDGQSVLNRWIDERLTKVSSVAVFGALLLSFVVVDLPSTVEVEIDTKSGTLKEITHSLQTLTTEESGAQALFLSEIESELSQEWLAEQKRLEEEKKAAEEAEAEALRLQEEQENSGNESERSPGSPHYTGGGSKEEWLRAAGIAESDWGYVEYIVERESGWNPNAVNPSSGASGLVQALPCGKVPGSCFNPVDNLRWANGYAVDRYGSWAGAYEFWVNNSWW